MIVKHYRDIIPAIMKEYLPDFIQVKADGASVDQFVAANAKAGKVAYIAYNGFTMQDTYNHAFTIYLQSKTPYDDVLKLTDSIEGNDVLVNGNQISVMADNCVAIQTDSGQVLYSININII